MQAGVKCNISAQKTRSRKVHPGVKYDISGHKCDEKTRRRPKVPPGEKSNISG